MSTRLLRTLAITAVLAMAATGCFYDAAIQSITDSPGTSPWWCTATTSSVPANSGAAYTGATKGALTDADCRDLSAQFDVVHMMHMTYTTVAAAEAAGYVKITDYETGIGARYARFDPSDLTAPGFDPSNPDLPGSLIDETFATWLPEFLHFEGTAASDGIVGASWMVETDATTPPDGFGGGNDWWARDVDAWCMDTATGARTATGIADVACTSSGGVNVDVSAFWTLNAWIDPQFRNQPDVFAASHPCLGGGGADRDPLAACRISDNDEVLRVLVGNDDGIDAEGIDVLVDELRKLPDVEVIVFAPLTEQSGSGDLTTPGGAPAAVADATSSGFPGYSVDGEPSDGVIAGVAAMAANPPDLVITGMNEGNNAGPFTAFSGTVGAAKTAARLGVPALATSQQDFLGGPNAGIPADFEGGVHYVVDWVVDNREGILAGAFDGPGGGAPAVVTTMDMPTCPTGTVRGVITGLPIAATLSNGNPLIAQDCESSQATFVDDVDALTNGYVVIGTLTPVNDTPVAVDDVGATDNGSVLSVPAAAGVLSNDRDGIASIGPDVGDSWSVTAFDAVSASGAAVTVAPDGSFTYDPTSAPALTGLASGATVDDTFEYTVTDSFGAFDSGTVTITVTGL